MSQDVERVIQTIQRLSASEQEKVLQWLEERKPVIKANVAGEENLEREILERLLAKGLLSEIVEPMTDDEDDEVEPIEIEGEPLSEMIIRERR